MRKYIGIVGLIVAIGIILGIIIIKPKESNKDLNFKYNDYSFVGLNSVYKIINDYETLERTLGSIAEKNIQNANSLEQIREKYVDYNFNESQLILINTSRSGCNYDNIKTNLSFQIEDNTLIIDINTKKHNVNCQNLLKQLTIIELNSKDITSVVVN